MRRVLSFSLATLIYATTVSAQLTTESIVVDGDTRTFLQYLPANFSPSETMPLVLSFHAGGGTGEDQLAIGDLRETADEERFLLVYPQALPDPNDPGSTNWQIVQSGELPFTLPNPHSDIDFISALIEEMGAQHGIDLSRVYAMGYSNGGGFVYDLACRLNDQITGIGAVARTMYAESYANCATSHPTPVVTILGTNDFQSIYDGITYQGILYYHSSDEGNALWIEKNGLLDSPEVTEMPNLSTNDGSSVERYRWTDAEDCIELIHYKVNGGSHDWPGSFGNMDIVSHEVIWDHLKDYNMEGKISCDFEGCMDQEACNFDPAATEDDGSCLEQDECGICEGSGIAEGYCDCDGNTLDVVGICGGNCTVDSDNNGVCDDQEVYGCAYELADNYDVNVTRDDGSCIFPCEGVVNTNVFDWDGDYVVTVTDFLMMLSVYGDTDVDLDGIWDSGDDCVDTNACNYANDPSEPCTYIDVLGVCGGGCEADEDSDGICDDIDDCVGVIDECGVCNGPGPTEVVIEGITIMYDSVYAEQIDTWFVFEVGADTTFSYTCAPLFGDCGEPVSYQGYDYATVLIGDQCWFAENLRSENYENGDAIPSVLSESEWETTNSGAVAVYGEGAVCNHFSPDGDACDQVWSLNEYGRLYNWFAVDDTRGLCPSGWHVPTHSEWTIMTDFLDGQSGAGVLMKTNYGWMNGGNGTNSSGFSGLPGGRRDESGDFDFAGYGGMWWSSSPAGDFAWDFYLDYYYEQAFTNVNNARYGHSVRCVQNPE